MKRRLIVFIQAACLFLAALSILVGFGHFSGRASFDIDKVFTDGLFFPSGQLSANATGADNSGASIPQSDPFIKDGNYTLLQVAPTYIKAIMTPGDTSFPRLGCPVSTPGRYEYLRSNATIIAGSDVRPKYFFALDLYQCANLLPRLIGSIVETMRYLGPKNCALSVIEGRSDDGTFEILKLLRTEIEGIGSRYFFNSSDLDPSAGPRIPILAELRNEALKPLTQYPERYSINTTVVFLNDVAICSEDILELIHQRIYQGADMVCAMDWTFVGQDPTFYDVWVARGINGDSFFEIPEDGNWNSAWNLFWNDPQTHARYTFHKPFQVFSCWNGATAFTARPLLEQKIHFRGPSEHECYQGEPQLFCKDMWHFGYGKIAVVPSANLEYSDDAAQKIKDLKGYVSQWVTNDGESADDRSMMIDWERNPPALVKCMASYENQTWIPWNE